MTWSGVLVDCASWLMRFATEQMPDMAEHSDRDVYFEFIAIGKAVKVTAIDSLTGIEVSIMGPAKAAQADLKQVALQKLRARLRRES